LRQDETVSLFSFYFTLTFEVNQGNVIEKTRPEQTVLVFRVVLGIVPIGGDEGIRTH
jgi:hypothetical protein